MSVENLKNNPLNIVIVGAGPAGSLAAYLLALRGHKVQVLERKKSIERKVCGEYLCPKGVDLLEQLNLLNHLGAGFSPLHGMVLVSPENEVIPSYFPHVHKKEKGLSLNREIFDQRLVDLATMKGADILFERIVTSVVFDQEKRQWAVHTDKESFECDLLIAADGRQSKIGHLLKHSREAITDRVALHCYLPRKTHHGLRLGEMHILENGSYCGLDPIDDDHVNFSIVCNASLLKNHRPEEIINQTIAGSKRLQEMFDFISRKTEIRIVSSLKNSNSFIAGDHLAYLGDAAGFIDPLTGEGIYNALLSASLLIESIDKNHGLDLALAEYKRKKKILSLQKNMLNHFFQFLIRRPLLVGLVVKFLNKSPERANHFIGIIGNIHTPIQGIIKMLRA